MKFVFHAEQKPATTTATAAIAAPIGLSTIAEPNSLNADLTPSKATVAIPLNDVHLEAISTILLPKFPPTSTTVEPKVLSDETG